MTEKPTLADFAAEDSKTAGDASATISAEPEESEIEHTDSAQPRPETTYGWGEYTCADCGTDCTAVWRDGEELVCPTCKAW